MASLNVGDPAPDFALPDQEGRIVRRSDYLGKKLALYFYPKDFTPGCTSETVNLASHYDALQAAGLDVVGISPDSVESHRKFAEKYQVPFRLLSDEDHTVAEAYGVWGEKKMYGRTYMGIHRTTFLIDEKGVIFHIFKKVKVKEHAQQILTVVKR